MKQPLGIMKQDPGEDPPRAPSMELPEWLVVILEVAALCAVMFGLFHLGLFIQKALQ